MSLSKPSSKEEEFFAKEDAEKKRKLALERAKAVAAEERDRLKKLHHMHCPKCGMQLQEIALRGVLVDKCFSCNGVYLDDGELAKLAGAGGYMSSMLQFFARRDYSDAG